nr:fimbria/pilus outer membrane usher protein [Dyella sp. ASV24]
MSSRTAQQQQKFPDTLSCLRPSLLFVLIAASLLNRAHAAAAAIDPAAPAYPSPSAVGFDNGFFPSGTAPKVDLSRFEKSGYVPPGTYHGDVVVNRQWREHGDIVFESQPGSDNVTACFDPASLTRYGIDLKKVEANRQHPADPRSPGVEISGGNAKPSVDVSGDIRQTADAPHSIDTLKPIPQGRFCGQLGEYISGATVDFDAGSQTLTLSVPQIYMLRSARGYVDPSQWDAGINAVVVNYTANAYSSTNHGVSQASGYVGINASANLGSWHVYQLGSLSFSKGGHTRWQNAATYLQHDIPAWKAQMVLGDTFTPGDMFDSVRVRGARVFSDDRMLPQSLRGYAPIVRGVAETNAKVTIRQRGYILYETNVAPGPFVIDDLYPTGYGGDLDVVVTEADGRIKEFAVPYSSVTQLLRPGLSRWSVTAGKVNELNLIDQPKIVQGTYQRGLTNLVTGYTGATLATGYNALLVGGALNTDIGAFSADVTYAHNATPGQASTQGESLRLGYNKNFIDTGTNFAVAAYRYSTSGYVDLQSATQLRDAAARGINPDYVARDKSRMDVSINQSFGATGGQLYLTGSVRNFWNQSGKQVDFSAGYSNQWRSISYSLSAQRTRNSLQPNQTVAGLVNQIPGQATSFVVPNTVTQRDTRIFFSMTVPLGRTQHSPTLNAMYNHSQQTGDSEMVTVSGTAGADNRISYGATLNHQGGDTAVSLNGQYNSSVARFSGGYNQGGGYRQFGAGMAGGVVVHEYGATWGPSLGDTVGLVYAPGARGAAVQNSQGATVDINGYAVVPNLMPYELNTVSIDPKGTQAGVAFEDTSRNVAPRAGSVVLLKYDTTSGRALIVDTSLPDGRPVPFGADVFDEQGTNVGVAGQASRLFINGLNQSGTVTVRWGDAPTESCRIQISLPDKPAKVDDYEKLQAPCTSANAPKQDTHAAATWLRQSRVPTYGGDVLFPSIALNAQRVV